MHAGGPLWRLVQSACGAFVGAILIHREVDRSFAGQFEFVPVSAQDFQGPIGNRGLFVEGPEALRVGVGPGISELPGPFAAFNVDRDAEKTRCTVYVDRTNFDCVRARRFGFVGQCKRPAGRKYVCTVSPVEKSW